jgi:hypothetical protein
MSISTTRTAIMEGVKDTVRAYDSTPPQPTFPCVIVGFPSTFNPQGTLTADTAEMSIPVTLYAPYASNRGAEDLLESLIGPVVEAIEDIGTDYAVTGVRDFGVLENSQQQPVALGCIIDVSVL